MDVKIVNIKRHFGKTQAVDDISFSFSSGHIFAFVGPNGAGKTTTMRILATLDDPTEGNAYIDGVSLVDDPEKARRLVGFMPDTPARPPRHDRARLPRLLRPGLRPARREAAVGRRFRRTVCQPQGHPRQAAAGPVEGHEAAR